MTRRAQARNRGPSDSDSVAVRRASRIVALRITAVSTALVLIVLALAVGFIVDQSRPAELLEKSLPGQDKIYVDGHEVVTALVVLGAVTVALAGVASWLVSRSAVRPLGEALRLQREFVADASHELRTPLSILDARLQLLQRTHDDSASRVALLAALRNDSRSLNDVVTDLLIAAAGSPDGPATCEVSGAVARTVESMAVIAGARGITLTTDLDAVVDEAAWVALAEASFRRCLVALLDNAVAHAPDGSEVALAALVGHGLLQVTVSDSGTGISGVEPRRIFERFARSETSAPPSGRRGFGIGLALVRDVAVRAGGSVTVESTSTAGTTMRLTLPTAPRPARPDPTPPLPTAPDPTTPSAPAPDPAPPSPERTAGRWLG
ncbi:sensor histidine kinase [uncultured Amnibacterium sp.]|uniref:sensor histidine kinase n=1 Tax=uncultured Amnibacterium sp. TaxID=1631851 RepID=UPI0035CC6344